jgi:uncharacterized protein YndB with AHSA1/START domain
MIDIVHQINAVQRQVGDRVIEAGEARSVIISQSFDATVEDVWDACTNPERLPRWFLPITGDLRLHGTYQLEGNAGGTIYQCDPPHGFAATWEFGESVSWIEVRLIAVSDERTRLELEHLAVPDEHWVEFGPGAAGIGWEMAFVGLALHLTHGEPVDPKEVAAWLASDDGKEFVRRSRAGWNEADVAGGADEAAARSAADNSAAFYTGAGG